MAEEELSDIHLPRRGKLPDDHTPECVAAWARKIGMRFTENDRPHRVGYDKYISGPKERDIFIPHRMPIDKADACPRRLAIV